MKSGDDVRLEGAEDFAGRDVLCRGQDVTRGGIGDEDVDLTDFFDDGGNAVVVRDRGGVGGDFGVRVLGVDVLLCFVEDFLATLDDD